MSRCEVQVRQAFVRKVLGIVLVQLLVTVGASVSTHPLTNPMIAASFALHVRGVCWS